ncbi:MAG: hypothetical protein U1E59_02290 [Amaricoccus sp.]
MDPVTMTYYALICGGLGYVSPHVSPSFMRVVLGAVVGLVAAAALPVLRRLAGL